jgi:hypothetical protein
MRLIQVVTKNKQLNSGGQLAALPNYFLPTSI